MKAIIDGKEENLIPYKGSSKVWWDGKDASRLHNFADIVRPAKTSTLNSSYSAVRLKLGVHAHGSVEIKNREDINKKG